MKLLLRGTTDSMDHTLADFAIVDLPFNDRGGVKLAQLKLDELTQIDAKVIAIEMQTFSYFYVFNSEDCKVLGIDELDIAENAPVFAVADHVAADMLHNPDTHGVLPNETHSEICRLTNLEQGGHVCWEALSSYLGIHVATVSRVTWEILTDAYHATVLWKPTGVEGVYRCPDK